jgi:hypothetical protein
VAATKAHASHRGLCCQLKRPCGMRSGFVSAVSRCVVYCGVAASVSVVGFGQLVLGMYI